MVVTPGLMVHLTCFSGSWSSPAPGDDQRSLCEGFMTPTGWMDLSINQIQNAKSHRTQESTYRPMACFHWGPMSSNLQSDIVDAQFQNMEDRQKAVECLKILEESTCKMQSQQ